MEVDLYTIITNNRLVNKNYKNTIFVYGDFRDVLIKTRDYLHRGYKLETSPLPASIRMLFSPIRTIIISDNVPKTEDSILILEQSIEKYDITMGKRKPDYHNEEDYVLLDFNLMKIAIKELPNFTIQRR